MRAQAIRGRHGFTVVELLVVMAVIVILAALILSTSGYVQKKGARSRAEAEIAAMAAALESYKADNGIYVSNTITDQLNPTDASLSNYQSASAELYKALSGDTTANRQPTGKTYMSFKNNQLSPPNGTGTVAFIRDPFGNPYGYSTMKASNPAAAGGYNPTFDLWSLGDGAPGTLQTQWIKNW